MSTLAFYAQFVANKVGLNGLTVTWDIEQITRSDGTLAALVTGGANSITVGRRGLYGYLLTGADTKVYDYVATAITSDATVDQKEIAALWTMHEADALKIAATLAAVPGAIGGLPVLDANLAASANVTLWKGVAPADLDGYGNVDANVNRWRDGQPQTLDSGGNVQAYAAEASGTVEQQIRDAMRLAPTAGDPAAGSVDKHLDDLLTYAAAAEPADVWTYASRTLTESSTASTDSTTAGSISRRRGDSWSISLILGAITGYTSLWFTIKSAYGDADSAAILQVKKNASGSGDGLLYANGATAGDATKASITVNDATTGAITIAVDESITDDLSPAQLVYDAQALIAGAVTTPDSGTFTITADVTRSIA